MIRWIGAAFLVVGLVVLARMFGLVQKSGDVVTASRRSLGVIRSPSLSDEEKEAALKSDAGQLFRLFFILAFGGAGAVLLPVGVLWLCDQLGLLSLASVYDTVLSPAFLIVSCLVAIPALFMGSNRVPETTSYSSMDRALHYLAFKTGAAQVSVADIEDKLFAGQLAPFRADRPVFITALPRAGTTLLLECCAGMREFAAHCYRDMPFVLIPCLWSRFSAAFQQNVETRERAHGDGMIIGLDSPEALEEVLWKAFWRRQYRSDRIIPWKDGEVDEFNEFNEFFRSHMRKIILLRRGNLPGAGVRYLSKNNLNIARPEMLHRLFPDSVIVVPFRHPLHHATSMLEQHRNFSRIHEEDPFASDYMRAIGHFDFGKNLRPIDFDGWFDGRESRDFDSLAFWLEYWVVGYRCLLTEHADILHLISYEDLCADPGRGLQVVADVIGSRDPDELLSAAAGIRSPRPRDVDTRAVPESLLREADRVYASLKAAALN